MVLQTVTCPDCQEALADGYDGEFLWLDGESFCFRRTTDWLLCDSCGAMHRVTDIMPAGQEPERRRSA